MRLTILFVSILIIGTCSAIQFDLPHSVLKCFKENYKKGQAVHGDVHGANNDNTGINFYVWLHNYLICSIGSCLSIIYYKDWITIKENCIQKWYDVWKICFHSWWNWTS